MDGPHFKLDRDPRVTTYGSHPEGGQHRRATPAVECLYRRDESHRAPAFALPREPDLRALAGGPFRSARE